MGAPRGRANKKKGWKKTNVSDVETFLQHKKTLECDMLIDQSNINKLYEITTTPSLANYIKEDNKFSSYSFKSLNQIAPQSYGTALSHYLSSSSSEDEDYSKFVPKNRGLSQLEEKNFQNTTKYTENPTRVSEDIWGLTNSNIRKRLKKVRQDKYSMAEFRPHLPSTGLSYNPDFSSYEKYLNSAIAFEMAKNKNLKDTKNSKRESGYDTNEESDGIKVLFAGECDSPLPTDERKIESNVLRYIPDRMKAKSKKEKLRKKLTEKINKQHLLLKNIEKDKNKSVQQLRLIQSSITNDANKLVKHQRLRIKKLMLRKQKNLLKKTLPSIAEIPLPEELSGSLRNVKPTLSVLENKAHHMRAAKILIKRRKKCSSKPVYKKFLRKHYKIMQDLDHGGV